VYKLDYFWGYSSEATVERIAMPFQTPWKKLSLRNLILQKVYTTEIVLCMNTCTSHRRVSDDFIVQGFDGEIIFLIISASQVKFVVYKITEYILVCSWERIYVPINLIPSIPLCYESRAFIYLFHQTQPLCYNYLKTGRHSSMTTYFGPCHPPEQKQAANQTYGQPNGYM
jgi:hypothetical protein